MYPNIRGMRVQRCFVFYRSCLKAAIASKKDWVKNQRVKTQVNVHAHCICSYVYVRLNYVCVNFVCILCPSHITEQFATILPCLWNCLCRPRSLQSNKHGAVGFPVEVSLSEPLPDSLHLRLPYAIATSRPENAGLMFWMDGVMKEDNYQAVSEVS